MLSSLSGVLPTATGSEVNRLSRIDGTEINNADMSQLLSPRGVAYIQSVIRANCDAGCTLGVTSTFRLTDTRPHSTRNWSLPSGDVTLSPQYRDWNRQLIDIAHNNYDDRPLLFNVCPLTNTSPSEDDRAFAQIGDEDRRILFARRHHAAQLRVFAEACEEHDLPLHVLIEAARHPDDVTGLALAARDVGASSLIAAHEAEKRGIPDPIYRRSDFTFKACKDVLEQRLQGDVDVYVGANCVGTSLLNTLFAQGEQLDIAYPNQRDSGRVTSDLVVELSAALNETSHDHDLRAQVRSLLDRHTETSPDELRSFWRCAIDARVSMIGICCGGRPEHVAVASALWSELKQ